MTYHVVHAGRYQSEQNNHGGPCTVIAIQQVPPWPQTATSVAGDKFLASRIGRESSSGVLLRRNLPTANQVCTGSLATWAPG